MSPCRGKIVFRFISMIAMRSPGAQHATSLYIVPMHAATSRSPHFKAIPTSKMDEMQTFVMSAAGLARSMFRVNRKLFDLGLSFIVMSRKPSSIFSSSSPRQPLGSARQCRNPVICVQTFSTTWPRVESMVHSPPSSAQMGREPFQQSLQDSDILSKEAQLGRRPVSPSHEEQLCKSILASLLPYDQQA